MQLSVLINEGHAQREIKYPHQSLDERRVLWEDAEVGVDLGEDDSSEGHGDKRPVDKGAERGIEKVSGGWRSDSEGGHARTWRIRGGVVWDRLFIHGSPLPFIMISTTVLIDKGAQEQGLPKNSFVMAPRENSGPIAACLSRELENKIKRWASGGFSI